MTWTTPKTWVAGEFVDASEMNIHIRDNLSDLDGRVLGYAQITTSQASIGATTTDITGLSTTVTAGSSRRIKVFVSCLGILSTVGSADRAELLIREGSTELYVGRGYTPAASADDLGAKELSVVLTPSSGSHTYKASMRRQAGTGTFTWRAATDGPSYILVQDIGHS